MNVIKQLAKLAGESFATAHRPFAVTNKLKEDEDDAEDREIGADPALNKAASAVRVKAAAARLLAAGLK